MALNITVCQNLANPFVRNYCFLNLQQLDLFAKTRTTYLLYIKCGELGTYSLSNNSSFEIEKKQGEARLSPQKPSLKSSKATFER